MTQKTKATKPHKELAVSQGDIFKNVKYSYIDKETDDDVIIIEMEFPFAVIISQACDVIAMSDLQRSNKGKATKFMPSILLCPIYDAQKAKKGDHISKIKENLKFDIEKEDLYHSDDFKVAKKEWHYRFHAFSVICNEENVIDNAIIDFKHYFTVPMAYLLSNLENRLMRLDDMFAEQLTLKFATYLSRVAIP